jgi:hypothetical protein
MWDNTVVKITPIPEMEGLQFATHYFGEYDEIFISPSIIEELKTGQRKDLQYVMLSWERPGRDIHEDMKKLVDMFESMPSGPPQFDVQERLDEYNKQLTGKPRIIVSPLIPE